MTEPSDVAPSQHADSEEAGGEVAVPTSYTEAIANVIKGAAEATTDIDGEPADVARLDVTDDDLDVWLRAGYDDLLAQIENDPTHQARKREFLRRLEAGELDGTPVAGGGEVPIAPWVPRSPYFARDDVTIVPDTAPPLRKVWGEEAGPITPPLPVTPPAHVDDCGSDTYDEVRARLAWLEARHRDTVDSEQAAALVTATVALGWVREVLNFFYRADLREALLWHVDGDHIGFAVGVNDFFWWGGADCEDVTPANFGALKQAYYDLKKVGDEGYAAELFAARQRGLRPQGAAMPKSRGVRALFEACGPERELDLHNPCRPPAVTIDETPETT